MKTTDYYGVQLTGIQAMMLSKYLGNNNIAMNTKQPEERKQIVLDFLNSLKDKHEETN